MLIVRKTYVSGIFVWVYEITTLILGSYIKFSLYLVIVFLVVNKSCNCHGLLGWICGLLVLDLGILGWDMVFFSTGCWVFFVANGLICGLLVYDLSNSSWFVSDSWPIRLDLWCVSVVFGDSRLGYGLFFYRFLDFLFGC